jgi:hypothetical protein
MSPYTAIIRRSGNPFELAHVLVSWLVGAGYDAYVVIGCAKRDVCMAIRYRTICPEIPDDTEVSNPNPAYSKKLNIGGLKRRKLAAWRAEIIIISLLMPPLQGHRPSLWVKHKEYGP